MARRLFHALNPSGLAVVAAALALWQALVAGGVLEYDYLPAPTEVLQGFGDIVSEGELWGPIAHTLGVAALASAIACVIGVTIGTIVGLVAVARTYTMASIDVLRTLPVVALMPVALLVWGPTGKTEIIVATYAATWPIVINTAAGVRGVHPRLRDVGRTLRFSRAQILRKVILPATAPAILVGARLAIVTALIIAIVAEMLINPDGLGWALIQAQQGLQPDKMWAWLVVTGLIGVALNSLLVHAVRRVPGASLEASGR